MGRKFDDNDGGSAFPAALENSRYPMGMTLRAYLAAKAMEALISRREDLDMRGYEGWRNEFAREALLFADAMLKELSK